MFQHNTMLQFQFPQKLVHLFRLFWEIYVVGRGERPKLAGKRYDGNGGFHKNVRQILNQLIENKNAFLKLQKYI